MQDIIRRELAEAEVHLLTFALNRVREATYLIDEQARLRYVNDESCRALQYTREELLACTIPDIDPDFSMGRWQDHWRELREWGSLSYESLHRAKDGRVFPVEINANYIEYGEQGYNLALVRDISARKQAEREHAAHLYFFESMDKVNRALQSTGSVEQVLHDVLDVMMAVFGCDRAWLVFPCDPQAPSWRVPMERTRPEYPGGFALGTDFPMNPTVAETSRLLLDTDGPLTFVGERNKPDPAGLASYSIRSFIGMALRPRTGQPWIFGMHQCSYERHWTQEEQRLFREVGRRLEDALTGLLAYRDLEQQVQERTAQLAEANRELETFAYSVSHDLKAPLRWIDGYSGLLQEHYGAHLDGEGQGFIGSLRRSVSHMATLIDDLLAYSRMERRALEAVPVELHALAKAVMSECTDELRTRRIELQVEVPPLAVHVDRDGLMIVLRNLLENALKFTRNMLRPRIEIGARDDDARVLLWVRDNGIGFDMQFHDRIFDIFQRLQHVDNYPGTGVGLAMVRKAVQRMGGRVWAQSVPGEGAIFYVELPK